MVFLFCLFRGVGQASDPNHSPFRKAYAQIERLRAYFDVPFLCLTATANKVTTNGLIKLLKLRDPVLRKMSPERINIALYMERLKSPVDYSVFQPLLDSLLLSTATQKTIIYCQSIATCGFLYTFFKHKLREKYHKSLPVSMYHGTTLEHIKDRVLKEFSKTDSSIRVIVATCALGLGVDIKDISCIYHFGLPRDIEAFCQELGRSGRDGSESTSTLYFSNSQLGRCKDKHMKNYALNKTLCRRKVLLSSFDEVPVPSPGICCDVCSTSDEDLSSYSSADRCTYTHSPQPRSFR